MCPLQQSPDEPRLEQKLGDGHVVLELGLDAVALDPGRALHIRVGGVDHAGGHRGGAAGLLRGVDDLHLRTCVVRLDRGGHAATARADDQYLTHLVLLSFPCEAAQDEPESVIED
jgi:hypothetical protein